jgi:hypothetical protein
VSVGFVLIYRPHPVFVTPVLSIPFGAGDHGEDLGQQGVQGDVRRRGTRWYRGPHALCRTAGQGLLQRKWLLFLRAFLKLSNKENS